MNLLLKILLLLLVNAAGFEAMPVIIALAAKLGELPHLKDGSAVFYQFGSCLRAASLVWLAAALLSLGWLFVKNRELRTWLLLAPLYVTVLYTALVIVYFDFVPLS